MDQLHGTDRGRALEPILPAFDQQIAIVRGRLSSRYAPPSKTMVGILVLGDNHFIVAGPPPDAATALALVRQWSLISIGAVAPPELESWTIRTREFRENLEWAVIVPAERELSPAVSVLLAELSARGVPIQKLSAKG